VGLLGAMVCWLVGAVTLLEVRVSSIEYRVSGIEYRVSSIEYRVSSIEYRVSSIEYRVSLQRFSAHCMAMADRGAVAARKPLDWTWVESN
jgi:hypothetical protein